MYEQELARGSHQPISFIVSTNAFKFPAVLCLTSLTSVLNKQFQRVRSAAVAAPVKAGARGPSQLFPAWGSDAHGAWSPSHSHVDEVKILGEAGIFTSRHTAFRARPRRAAVPISHTELWGRRRQDKHSKHRRISDDTGQFIL